MIATYAPGDNDRLKKTLDGHIRIESEPNENGATELVNIEPNQQAKVVIGFLERKVMLMLSKK